MWLLGVEVVTTAGEQVLVEPHEELDLLGVPGPVLGGEGECRHPPDPDLEGALHRVEEGLLPRGVTADAVGHNHSIADLIRPRRRSAGEIGVQGFEKAAKANDREVIFIVRPHVPAVRKPRHVHHSRHGGRGALGFTRRMRKCEFDGVDIVG